MNECCGKNHCESEKCECVPGHKGCRDEGSCNKSHFFMQVADCAWMEVLKDLIKEHIKATDKDRMTELAKLISEGNRECWRSKMGKKHACKDFEEKLCHFFSKSKK